MNFAEFSTSAEFSTELTEKNGIENDGMSLCGTFLVAALPSSLAR